MNGLIDTPRHKDLIYDIGMHKGEDSEFYLRKGFRVIAFEADPDLVRFCRERLGEFVDRSRLTIIEGAVLDSDATDAGQGRVKFYNNIDIPALGTVCADLAELNARLGFSSTTVEVETFSLADVIQEHGMPHFMKIDIEGCDMACVRLLRRFRARPDFLSVESDKTGLAIIKREIDELVDLGYDRFKAVEQSGIYLNLRLPRIRSERVNTLLNVLSSDLQVCLAPNLTASGRPSVRSCASIAPSGWDTVCWATRE